ncbi:Ubiquitin carboxyl-terminal hydrolase 33 [Mortierella sp. AM989]|nr:Ubiquitin carboxyl-terminal hydrolase 33 [Mortierella sp. AM989]
MGENLRCEHATILAARPNSFAKIESTNFKASVLRNIMPRQRKLEVERVKEDNKNLSSASLKCDGCEVRVPRIWICLEESVKDACHCVFMNPRTLTIWCYRCDFELNPFVDNGLISPNGRLFLKSIIRCMQGKKSKQDGDGYIQDLDLPGLVGLKNLGNTCYMNAALQALSHTPALVNYFQECDAFIPEPRKIEYARQKNHMLVDSFFNFVDTMWSGKSAIFSPSHLVSDVKKCNDIFQGTSQQDSQEFLRCIMDKLHEELTYPRTSPDPNSKLSNIPAKNEKLGKVKAIQLPPSSNTNGASKEGKNKKGTSSSISYSSSRSSTSSRSAMSSENSSMSENVEITPARATAPSIISDIFEGTLESRVRCLICRKQYIKEDKFFDLSIPIDKKTKMIDDSVDDRNGGKDKDGGMLGSFVDSIGGWFSISNKTIKLQDCLASFCATEELTGEDRYRCTQCDALNDCRKTFRITVLPETLCIHLKRFRYDTYSSKINTYVQFPLDDLDMTPFFKSSDPNELRNTKYELYAMVRHRGVVGGGHYIGYAKHATDGSWYEFDDTYITRKAAADIAKMEAYILFYRRKSLHREEDRARISKFMTKPLMQIYDNALMPGPISNHDFLCPHGGINVTTTRNVLDMVMPIPKIAWDALVEMYGTDGSPIVNISSLESEKEMACDICQREELALEQRRKREDEDVSRLDSNEIGNGQLWYLIGADWLKEWHAFKSGDKPPGPIKNSQFLKDNGQPRAGMKRDYRGINFNVWNYLYNIYGGGPEFVRACTTEPGSPPPGWGATEVVEIRKPSDVKDQEEGSAESTGASSTATGANALISGSDNIGHSTAIDHKDSQHNSNLKQKNQSSSIDNSPGDKSPTNKKKKTPLPRYCRTCEAFKPPRSHHCRICKKCILKMDHHCPWINNCVGHYNYGHFVRFVTWVTITTGFCMVLLIWRIMDAIQNETYYMYTDFAPTKVQVIFMAVNIAVDGGVLLAVGILAVYHLWSLVTNTSTIEAWEQEKVEAMIKKGKLKKTKFPYDIGCFANYRQVLGPRIWLWLWPQQMLGSGTEFEVNKHKDAALIWPPREYNTSKKQDRTFVSEYTSSSIRQRRTRNLSSLGAPASPGGHSDKGRSNRSAASRQPPQFPSHIRRGSEGWVVQDLTIQQRAEMYDQQLIYQRQSNQLDQEAGNEEEEDEDFQEGLSDIEANPYSGLPGGMQGSHDNYNDDNNYSNDGSEYEGQRSSEDDVDDIPYDVISDEYDDDGYNDYQGNDDDDDLDQHNPYLAYADEDEEVEAEEYDEVALHGQDRHKIGRFFERPGNDIQDDESDDDWDEGDGVDVGCRPPGLNATGDRGIGSSSSPISQPGPKKTFYTMLVEREEEMKRQKALEASKQ